jgi:hypothetical protein
VLLPLSVFFGHFAFSLSHIQSDTIDIYSAKSLLNIMARLKE